jgi:hypothetical protein
VSIKLPIRSGHYWPKVLLSAAAAGGFFWYFYRTGFARNIFSSKEFNWFGSVYSILGVGILNKLFGWKRRFTIATVVLFTLAALVGKASEPQAYRFQLLHELWGPKRTKSTSPNLSDKRCGPYSYAGGDGREIFIPNLYAEGVSAFQTLGDFEKLFTDNVCNIRSILGSLGVNSAHNAVMARFDACDTSTNRIVLLTAVSPKTHAVDNHPFLHKWMDYGGTALYGSEYRTAVSNNSCGDSHELPVVIFPESGVMVDKMGLSPSFIPR